MGYLLILMYIINKMVYTQFIYRTGQSYTVCRKCISNNTSIQNKFTFGALQTLKKNEQDGTQTQKNTAAIQTNDNKVVHLHVLDPHYTITQSHFVFRDLYLDSISTNTVKFHNIHK